MALKPEYLYDNKDVFWYGTDGYYGALGALQKVTGKSQQSVEIMLNGKYGAADYWAACEALKDHGIVEAYNTNGIRCFAYQDKVTMTVPTGPMYQVDSNATATTIVKANPVYDVVVDEVTTSPTVGKVFANPMGSLLTPENGFYGWKFFAGECLQALSCASVGISLGKLIDSTLYNANPDYWDSIGLSSLNPETWNSITNGDDSFAAGLFNMVLGINPNTGKGQMFLDENAYAYIAQTLLYNDWFASGIPELVNPTFNGYTVPQPFYKLDLGKCTIPIMVSGTQMYMCSSPYYLDNNFRPCFLASTSVDNNDACVWAYQDGSSYINVLGVKGNYSPNKYYTIYQSPSDLKWYSTGGVPRSDYVTGSYACWFNSIPIWNVNQILCNISVRQSSLNNANQVALYGEWATKSTIDGVSNQENANLPDTSNWTSLQNTLDSLKQQYPDLWANAVPNQITQPDGTVQTINYIPVPMPDANGQWDTQPTSSTSLQTNPQVQPQPEPTPENNDLLRLLLQLVTLPEPQTHPQEDTDIPNLPDTPDTGDGDSPTPIVPTGSASALWSVYHPTQAQVNAFGGWLWSTDFVDQLIRVFENPMDAVVSLRKVFVTPVDAGNTTIHAGYLDSEVPSAYITQQYVYKDCGYINCYEQFGNVFDYLNTNISIYLPFIGIVPLNTSEVMRSTLHVIYGVDMFTGACLASIEVQRDGNTVTMYQYSGNASVEYPLSGQRASSFLGGLMSLGGAAAMAATGGGSVVAAGMAMHGVQQMSTVNVSHSGGFSGNAGAMGIKIPYLIIERPQTKVAQTFPRLAGYPTNHSIKLGECSNHVVVKHVHVEGINATDTELAQIESLLKSGVLV